MLEHGGRLLKAANQFGIALDQWIDVSTGINPQPWPVPMLPQNQWSQNLWSRLPEDEDGLMQAAQTYYCCHQILATAGSQASIMALPRLRRSLFPGKTARIGVLSPAYAEHAHAWQSSGFEVIAVDSKTLEHQLPQLDCLVLVNPNNPTAELFPEEKLLQWRKELSSREGWLIIDEAFMDCTPQFSLTNQTHLAGLIVLRSLGKFFGLAGARVGFVMAQKRVLDPLQELLGPWTISTASRWVACQALQDIPWQEHNRETLQKASNRLSDLLHSAGLSPHGRTTLFQWVKTPFARNLHEALAQQGILSRLFTEPLSLRFGLPKTDAQWDRLHSVLWSLNQKVSASEEPVL